MYEHILSGCRITPLASYLKSLAVLRILSTQIDPSVRGWWKGDIFVLRTALSENDLIQFMLNDYSPTPIVAPWGGSSGFWPGDNIVGIEAIESGEDERFKAYREVISTIKSWPEMPRSGKTVPKLVVILEQLVSKIESDKNCSKWKNLLAKEFETRQVFIEQLGLELANTISIDALEMLVKKESGITKKAATDWLKVVKKIRTDCQKIERDEKKDLILKTSRSKLSESCLFWLDAVYATKPNGTPSF
ncbi:type I-U CRISPR-associated protein Csx17, partial [bacterium]|nr:type I-U CRISPR-associated protein Csx17 [bacterium]